MKNTRFLLAIACFSMMASLYAQEEKECEKGCRISFTFKNGFFYPQECRLREIFDCCGSKGGYWPELAMGYNFWKRMHVELSGSYFKRTGKILGSCDNTEVTLPTLGLGLKYFFCGKECDCCCEGWCDRCSFFLGTGLRVFFYKEKNCTSYFCNCLKKTRPGGMVNFGFRFRAWRGLFFDLFADYNFGKLKACHFCSQYDRTTGSCKPSCFSDLKLGGIVAGIGIGYRF